MEYQYLVGCEKIDYATAIVDTEDDAVEMMIDLALDEVEEIMWSTALDFPENDYFVLRRANEQAIRDGFTSIFDPKYQLYLALKKVRSGEYFWTQVPYVH